MVKSKDSRRVVEALLLYEGENPPNPLLIPILIYLGLSGTVASVELNFKLNLQIPPEKTLHR